MTADIVTTLGSGVNGTVRYLGYTFDDAGRPFTQTSYTNTLGPSGTNNIANQVQDVYNSLGQLIKEYQAHTGAVNTGSTPKIQYGYNLMSGAVKMRSSFTWSSIWAVIAVVWLAVGVEAIRSGWKHDSASAMRSWYKGNRLQRVFWSVESARGLLQLDAFVESSERTPVVFDPLVPVPPDALGLGPDDNYYHFQTESALDQPVAVSDQALLGLGFRCHLSSAINSTMSHRQIEIGVPWWSLLLVLGIFLAVTARRRLLRWCRARRGLCLTCGYDVRHTNDRCPECGSATSHLRSAERLN